jgi:hypothetical protein
MVDFFHCMKLPLKYKVRLLYFYFLLVPVIGQLMVLGYFVKINKHLIEGNTDGFPYAGKIKQNAISGLKFFLFCLVAFLLTASICIVFYSLGFLINILFARMFAVAVLVVIFLIMPQLFVYYFETEKVMSVFEIHKAVLFLKSHALSYIKVVFFDAIQKGIYLLFPFLFIAGIFYFYQITIPTLYDLAGLIICLIGEFISLFIFLPVFFFSFFSVYSIHYNEMSEED